jgi:pantoate--beta-alanine ligase
MKTVHTVAELRSEVAAARRSGRTIALVPTMGNLHAGHASLVRTAAAGGAFVVASVFVNPLQFGVNEDFSRYPRTLEADAALLRDEGAALLFAPTVETMYPLGFPPATTVQVSGAITDQLEGEFRSGHFAGVATVVSILFNQVQPDVAVFGEKDYQQLQLIRRMAADLGLPVRVQGAPTLRADDGLALSSRNQYLQADERGRACRLYQALQAVAAGLRQGRRDFEALCDAELAALRQAGFVPQYLAVRAPDLTAPAATAADFVILGAAILGSTRLIDNIQVNLAVGR